MGTGRKKGSGGGGVSLSFKVVGGAVAPNNPKENTIWINTDREIPSYIFSATEPTNPVSGMVWISTGTISSVEFNALKKNSIQVYPATVRQYIDGAWVELTAKTYQNGAWVDWSRYLFRSGEQFEGITGGWSRTDYTISSDFNSTNNSQVTVDATIVCMANSGSTADKGGACGTANPIDATGYTTMRVKGNVSGYNSKAKLFVGVNTSKAITKSPTAMIALTANGDFEKTLTLPTSATSLYVFVLAACYTDTSTQYTSTLTVNEISFE